MEAAVISSSAVERDIA